MERVYISSTYLDLKEEREAVRNAVLRLELMPVSMEASNAAESPPLQLSLKDVASCQYYVGICAWKYGFIPQGQTRSITELEYQEASKRNIPRLLFLLDENAPWPRVRLDGDLARVTAWRRRLEQHHTVAYFKTADDLALKVIGALHKLVTGADAAPAELLSGSGGARVEIPPLLPYLSDRSRQEDALAEALAQEASRPVVCIIHGNDDQSHDQLLRRLEKDTLPRLLSLDVAVSTAVMGWPQDFGTYDELRRLLLRDLARELSLGEVSVERIDAALEALPGPALVHTHVLSRDFERRGAQLLEAYLHLWQRWPEVRPGRRLLVLLFVHYESAEHQGRWRGWRLERLNSQLERVLEPPGDTASGGLDVSRFDRLTVRVLPRLESVTETEAKNWARSSAVAHFCASAELLADIQRFYKEYEARRESPRIPMDTLAPELKRLLELHCRKESFV